MQNGERIDALEKRIAALEALAQAQQGVSIPVEAVVDSVIREINQQVREGGKPILLG